MTGAGWRRAEGSEITELGDAPACNETQHNDGEGDTNAQRNALETKALFHLRRRDGFVKE